MRVRSGDEERHTFAEISKRDEVIAVAVSFHNSCQIAS